MLLECPIAVVNLEKGSPKVLEACIGQFFDKGLIIKGSRSVEIKITAFFRTVAGSWPDFFISSVKYPMSEIKYFETRHLEVVAFTEWIGAEPAKGIQPFQEEQPLDEKTISSHTLFSLFTADIIAQKRVFVR